MTKKILTTIKRTEVEATPHSTHWSKLTDAQKARVLLNNNRLQDTIDFLAQFKSFEQPELDSEMLIPK